MASIKENFKGSKIVSFKFKVCLGRDENGKQIFRCMTWKPPQELSNAKSKKEAERAARVWEDQLKMESVLGEMNTPNEQVTFKSFVDGVWVPLFVRNGEHRPSTIAMYTNILKVVMPYFKDAPIDEISSLQITKYLAWLRNEYKTPQGKQLSEKSVKHHYNILGLIFNYAEKQDVINKNPMRKVDAPKVTKKAVDALSEEQAIKFFSALGECPIDFRCLSYLLITSGLRRGECLGLQWRDIDYENATINVERAVTYTPESGILVSAPKTANSIRVIPIMESVMKLLEVLKHKQERSEKRRDLSHAFIFGKQDDVFLPRDPNAVTRRMKRFVRSVGLPDFSPHDLRHTCASLLLSSGADIKSVQEILGHADARTTLNYYVKTDIQQMKNASNKFACAFGL